MSPIIGQEKATKLKENVLLRKIHRLDRVRLNLYNKRQELQRELEQVQADKCRLQGKGEVARDE